VAETICRASISWNIFCKHYRFDR